MIALGGIVGENHTTNVGTIKNSYSTMNISGKPGFAGGIVGNTGTITNCYYLGEITTSSDHGGIIGYYNNVTVTNSYYCSDIIKEPTNTRGTGLTKANMKLKSSYSGWDISSDENATTIWLIRDGECPILRWMK